MVVLSASNKIRCDAQHVDAFQVSLATRGQSLPLSLLNGVIGAGGLHLPEWFGPVWDSKWTLQRWNNSIMFEVYLRGYLYPQRAILDLYFTF